LHSIITLCTVPCSSYSSYAFGQVRVLTSFARYSISGIVTGGFSASQ
jgi:hypothetical protein